MITLVDVLKKTSDYFESRGIPSPRLDAELIIGHSLGLDRMALYMNFDRPLTEGELQAIRPLVRRRGEREPVAWITGSKGFHIIAHDHGVDLRDLDKHTIGGIEFETEPIRTNHCPTVNDRVPANNDPMVER